MDFFAWWISESSFFFGKPSFDSGVVGLPFQMAEIYGLYKRGARSDHYLRPSWEVSSSNPRDATAESGFMEPMFFGGDWLDIPIPHHLRI